MHTDIDNMKNHMPHPHAASALTWWFTGLPAAGKSTLAQALRQALIESGRTACILDGDELRECLSSDLGFGMHDREENMRRAAAIARLLNDQGIHAIVAMVSPIQAGRERARELIGDRRFLEIHVSTPLAICAKRDPKGLYARARHDTSLQLTGLAAPYQPPVNPHLCMDTSVVTLDEATAQLLGLLHSTPQHN